MNKTLDIMKQITQLLVTANVATPIVFGTISAIAAIIKGITGTGPTLSELADILEKQVGQTDANIRAEIARLEAKLPPNG